MDLDNTNNTNGLELLKRSIAVSEAQKAIEKDPAHAVNLSIMEKLEIELERRNRSFSDEMQKIRDQIKEIESSINLMRQDIKNQTFKTETRETVKPSIEIIEKASEPNGFKRYSEYKPEEVSVDKIFYMGKNGNR